VQQEQHKEHHRLENQQSRVIQELVSSAGSLDTLRGIAKILVKEDWEETTREVKLRDVGSTNRGLYNPTSSNN
jgi:hypothetical protein